MTRPRLTGPRLPRAALAFLLLGVLALAPRGRAGTEEFRARVIGITDGDTIVVLHEGSPEKIRLHGIDAPEKGQPFGARARQFASQLAFGHEVTVHVVGRDRYGRTVGDVVLPDGRSLGRELVRAGYAWWFRRYSTDRTLGDLEETARAARVGLWADPRPVPPWDWRRTQASSRRAR